MAVIATALRHMFKAGMSPEEIVAAVEEMEAEQAPKRTARQERNARYYQKKASEKRLKASETSYSDESVLNKTPSREPTRVEDNLLTKNQSGQKTRKQENAPAALREFDAFWSLYPNKVGKQDAERKFAAALSRASFETIMAGLKRYVAKTDDRPWCNPATFLHQGRWEDMPATAPPRTATGPPPQDDFNSILDGYINGSRYDDHPQPDHSFDAGHGGPDRRGAQGVVQLYGAQTRR